MKVAVFGATGPIGRRLTRALLDRDVEVRVVSRSADNLERDFGDTAAEPHVADLDDPGAAREAARGTDLVVHAVGLPAELFERHVPIARNAVEAAHEAGARSFLVTSYWSYGPGGDEPMPESRPRTVENRVAAVREREEEVFLEGGGAVARLPDFYGPEPALSLLNDGLEAVIRGETVSWPGDPDAPRDFLYYPDAGHILADLALRDEAYGEVWNVPGSGARAPRALLAQAADVAGTRLRIRRIRLWMARFAALFKSDVRPFLDVIPLYDAPAVLDTGKIEALLGPVRTTPYEESIPRTVAWLQSEDPGAT